MFGTPLGGREPGASAWDFLARLYRQKGASKDFDGVAVHPYASKITKVLAQVDLLRDVMVEGRDKRTGLWITEIGWSSGGAPNPLNRGLEGQADRLSQVFRKFVRKRRKLNLESLIWYSWRDNTWPARACAVRCPKSGLLNENGTTKPSFDAFTRFTGGS